MQNQDPYYEWAAKRSQREKTPKKPNQPAYERFNLLPLIGAVGGGILGGAAASPSILGVPAGVIAGGAAGAGLGEGLEQFLTKKPNLKGLAAETALGGLAGPLGKALSYPVRGAANLITGSSRPLAATGLKIAPQSFTRAAESGVDLIKTYLKWAPKIGIGLDKQVGAIGKSSSGKATIGGIQKLLNASESTIQDAIKTSGNTKVFKVTEITNSLNKHVKELAKIPGNEKNIASLQDFIAGTTSKYSKGFSAKDLINIKRAADSKFGAKVLDEQVGSVAAQGQKVIANAARSLLKGRYKNIATALDDEQELILLKQMLSQTRGKVEAGGLPKGIGDLITKPLGDVGRNLPSLNIGGKTLRTEAAPGLINAVQTTIGKGLTGLPFGSNEATSPESLDQSLNQLGGPSGAEQPAQPNNPFPPELLLQAIQQDPKNYNMYSSLFKMFESRAKKSAPTASDEFIAKAEVALDSIEGTKTLGYGPAIGRLYQFQSDVLGGEGLPNEVLELDVKYKVLKLAILRAYQGARISDKDFELANTYIPSLSSTDAKAKINLKLLRELITKAPDPSANQAQQEQPQDYSALMQQLGL